MHWSTIVPFCYNIFCSQYLKNKTRTWNVKHLQQSGHNTLWQINALARTHWDAVQKSLSDNFTLHWRHNELDGVSDHQPHDRLLTCLFRHRWKKTSKLRVTGLCEGNSPGTGDFPAQKASNAENVSIWWRHHDQIKTIFKRTAILTSKFANITQSKICYPISTDECGSDAVCCFKNFLT